MRLFFKIKNEIFIVFESWHRVLATTGTCGGSFRDPPDQTEITEIESKIGHLY
jgi:hypothetical protein